MFFSLSQNNLRTCVWSSSCSVTTAVRNEFFILFFFFLNKIQNSVKQLCPIRLSIWCFAEFTCHLLFVLSFKPKGNSVACLCTDNHKNIQIASPPLRVFKGACFVFSSEKVFDEQTSSLSHTFKEWINKTPFCLFKWMWLPRFRQWSSSLFPTWTYSFWISNKGGQLWPKS